MGIHNQFGKLTAPTSQRPYNILQFWDGRERRGRAIQRPIVNPIEMVVANEKAIVEKSKSSRIPERIMDVSRASANSRLGGHRVIERPQSPSIALRQVSNRGDQSSLDDHRSADGRYSTARAYAMSWSMDGIPSADVRDIVSTHRECPRISRISFRSRERA